MPANCQSYLDQQLLHEISSLLMDCVNNLLIDGFIFPPHFMCIPFQACLNLSPPSWTNVKHNSADQGCTDKLRSSAATFGVWVSIMETEAEVKCTEHVTVMKTQPDNRWETKALGAIGGRKGHTFSSPYVSARVTQCISHGSLLQCEYMLPLQCLIYGHSRHQI